MTGQQTATRRPSPVGTLLRHWRQVRHMSQFSLAVEAEVSPRHICFVETGRASPSKEMVLTLARALDVPLRERNALLLAAGFAPAYRETDLESPELGAARYALDAILRQQEPYPAVVLNRHWDILKSNPAAARFFGFLLAPAAPAGSANVIRMMFDPAGLRPFVVNWEQAAETLLRRIHREAVGGALDEPLLRLIEEVLGLPGVPQRWRTPDPATPLLPVIPVHFRKAGRDFSFFSTVTTLGTAQDVTLQELRIECFFPLDAETRQQALQLAHGTDREPYWPD